MVAVVFVCLSLTPSLLPRTWQMQGAISGISATVGYGTGVVLAWLWRRIARRPAHPVGATARWILGAAAAAMLAYFFHQGSTLGNAISMH